MSKQKCAACFSVIRLEVGYFYLLMKEETS